MKKLLLSLLLAAITLFGFAQTSTIFTYGSTWLYKDDGSNQNLLQYQLTNFPLENTWLSGPGQLGYGDGDEATLMNACGTTTQNPSCTNKYITTYFRKTFTIANTAAFGAFTFNLKRDDGAVVYVNGTEIYRTNMPTGLVLSSTLASSAASDDGNGIQTNTFTVADSKLVNGSNVIAVEIHQNAGTSSDISFDMELIGSPAIPILTRGPYQQILTQDGVTLRWRTNLPATSKVKFGVDSLNLKDSIVINGSRTEHTVKLSGLEPYTQYYYSIGNSVNTLQGDGNNYFRTAPLKGAEGKYTFFVTGDCGNNSTNQKNVLTAYNNFAGKNLTDGWLLLGDNAYSNGTDDEFTTEFFNIYQSTIMKKTILWPAPGNHDYDNGSPIAQNTHAVPYYDMFNTPTQAESGGVASNTEAFYSYDYGNVHFLSLDSYGKEDNTTRLYDTLGAQVTWIKRDLAANKLPFVIAYWHHPPYTMGSHNSDTETELLLIRQNFIRILERNGVDMIMCGHSHDYERSKLINGHYGLESTFNPATMNVSQSTGKYDGTANSCTYIKDSTTKKVGTIYVLSGSAGQLGGTQTSFPHSAMTSSDATNGGSFVITIEGNRMDAKWLNADGQIRDKFTLIKETNKKTLFNVPTNDSVTLTASWNGDFRWQGRSDITKSIRIKAINPTETFIVTDAQQCVADTFTVSSFTVLPVSIASFTAKKNGNKNLIEWATVTEQNNAHFLVQKSADGFNFNTIGKVASKATNGNSSVVLQYNFVDENPNNGANYYRLQQTSVDGKTTNSQVVKLISTTNGFVSIFPNPAKSSLNVQVTVEPKNDVTINVTDASGKLVKKQSSKNALGKINIAVDISDVKNGFYFIQIFAGNELIHTEKITKVD